MAIDRHQPDHQKSLGARNQYSIDTAQTTQAISRLVFFPSTYFDCRNENDKFDERQPNASQRREES